MITGCKDSTQVRIVHPGIQQPAFDQKIQRIAFGSCNDQDDPQLYWEAIKMLNPDLWIWMGDNIYADTEDMNVMKKKYIKQLSHPEYRSFINDMPVIGIWDDHDYGINDGNRNYSMKEESKTLMLDFLGVPDTSAVRSRKGAYQSYEIGEKDCRMKIILLDLRTFQEPLKRNLSGNPRYYKNEGDLLGEEQWTWLEKELTGQQALNIIVSSLQFINEEQIYEKWDNFPKSKERVLNLLRTNQRIPSVILSGDRHIAEVSMIKDDRLGYPLFDITSSGLTHSFEDCKETNQNRVGPLVTSTNFGILEFNTQNDSLSVNVSLYHTDGTEIFQMELMNLGTCVID